jgi:hypothetical protein
MGYERCRFEELLEYSEEDLLKTVNEQGEPLDSVIRYMEQILKYSNNCGIILNVQFKKFVQNIKYNSRMFNIIRIYFNCKYWNPIEYSLLLNFMICTQNWDKIPRDYICDIFDKSHELLQKYKTIGIVYKIKEGYCKLFIIINKRISFISFNENLLEVYEKDSISVFNYVKISPTDLPELKDVQKICILNLVELQKKYYN